MDVATSQERVEREDWIEKALCAYRNNECSSLRQAARDFNVSLSTLQARMAGRSSRSNARGTQQTLSNAKETALVRWITRLTCTGFPASPKLVMEMAQELRRGRVQLSSPSSPNPRPIGYSWLEQFKTRYPELEGVWARQIAIPCSQP